MRVLTLGLVLGCFSVRPIIVGGLDACVDVDPNNRVARWKCDLGKRTYAEKGTAEWYLSISSGAVFNAALSLVAGTLDLSIAGLAWFWNVFLSIPPVIWGWLVAYAQWCPPALGAMWTWWYAAMWHGMVVAAWDTFFLLGFLAFIPYLPWVILGIFVCTLSSIVLLLLVVVVFIFVGLAIIVVFALFVILGILMLGLSIVVLVLVSILALIVDLGALLVIGVIVIALLCLGWFLCMISMAAVGVVLVKCVYAAVRMIEEKAKANKQDNQEEATTEDNEDQAKTLPASSLKSAWSAATKSSGFVGTVVITYYFFLLDVQIAETTYQVAQDLSHTHFFPNTGRESSLSTAVASINPRFGSLGQNLKDLGVLFRFIGGFSVWLHEQCNFVCPGGAAIFGVSQMTMGVVVMSALGEDKSIKSNLVRLLSKTASKDAQPASKILTLLGKSVICKVIEALLTGPAVFLLFYPNLRATCDYEGDVITAVVAYVVLAFSTAVCLVILLSIAWGNSVLKLKGLGFLLQRVFDLTCATVGYITKGADEQMKASVCNYGNRINKSKTCGYHHTKLSLQMASFAHLVLPFGHILSKCMVATNEGVVHWDDDDPDSDEVFYGWAVKILGYLKALVYIICPLLSKIGKVIVVLIALPVVALSVWCNDTAQKAMEEKEIETRKERTSTKTNKSLPKSDFENFEAVKVMQHTVSGLALMPRAVFSRQNTAKSVKTLKECAKTLRGLMPKIGAPRAMNVGVVDVEQGGLQGPAPDPEGGAPCTVVQVPKVAKVVTVVEEANVAGGADVAEVVQVVVDADESNGAPTAQRSLSARISEEQLEVTDVTVADSTAVAPAATTTAGETNTALSLARGTSGKVGKKVRGKAAPRKKEGAPSSATAGLAKIKQGKSKKEQHDAQQKKDEARPDSLWDELTAAPSTPSVDNAEPVELCVQASKGKAKLEAKGENKGGKRKPKKTAAKPAPGGDSVGE